MAQTVIITGCSSGFGRDLALALARGGHRVAATMRAPDGKNAEAAQLLRQRAEGDGLSLRVLDLDVTSDASVEAAADSVTRDWGAPDTVVNNAGQMFGGVTEAFTSAEMAHQLDVNVVGVHRVTRAFLPAMRERGRGLVVNMSSTAGRAAVPFFGVYHASKWALEGYSQALRGELASSGVDVVLIEPGPFATNLFPNTVRPEDADGRAETYPAAVHEAFEGVGAAFDALFADPDAPTDPGVVVDAIAGLIEAAPGTRPLRTCVGVDFGVRERNAAIEPHDVGLLEALGMTDLATLTGADPTGVVPAAGGDGTAEHATLADAVTFEFEQTATGPGTFEGTFTASGAVEDAGTTEDALDVSSPEGASPLVATFRRTVTGARGTLVLTGDATVDLEDPADAPVVGTWRVESGTGAYTDRTGSGEISGTADFTRERPHGRLRYDGSLRVDR